MNSTPPAPVKEEEFDEYGTPEFKSISIKPEPFSTDDEEMEIDENEEQIFATVKTEPMGDDIFYGFDDLDVQDSRYTCDTMTKVAVNRGLCINDTEGAAFRGFQIVNIQSSYDRWSVIKDRISNLPQLSSLSYESSSSKITPSGQHNNNNNNKSKSSTENFYAKQYTSKFSSTPRSSSRSEWNSRPVTSSSFAEFGNVVRVSKPAVKCRFFAPLQAWEYFFTDSMIGKIVYYTNKAIRAKNYHVLLKDDAKETSLAEIKTVFGLIYLAGILEKSQITFEDMWCPDGTGIDVCLSTMSLKRFKFLMNRMQFSDGKRANNHDVLAPVRDLVTEFLNNCKDNYHVGDDVVVREKIQFFRGKCEFVKDRHKVKGVKKKCGLKMFYLVDCANGYVYNAVVRTEKEQYGSDRSIYALNEDVARLLQPVYHTGRTVFTDQRFTSFLLSLDLLKDYGLKSIGLIQRNRCDIQRNLIEMNTMPVYSSKFAFNENMTLASYMAKKGQVMHVLSTVHRDGEIDRLSGFVRRPRIVSTYNRIMDSVETFEKQYAPASVCKKALSWPCAILYALLDIAVVNSFLLCQPSANTTPVQFVKILAIALAKDFMLIRSKMEGLDMEMKMRLFWLTRTDTQHTAGQALFSIPSLATTSNGLVTKGRCEICPRSKDRKTKFRCASCARRICGEHSLVICEKCNFYQRSSVSLNTTATTNTTNTEFPPDIQHYEPEIQVESD